MKGLLIVNGYMRTPKFEEITQLYKEAAGSYGVNLQVCYTDEIAYGMDDKGKLWVNVDVEEIGFVLFLDKDIVLAQHLETLGLRVFNTSAAIGVCDHKGMTMQALSGANIAMPKTIIAPLVFEGMYDEKQEDRYIRHIEEELSYPLIVKECYGSFGMQVYKIEDTEALVQLRSRIAHKPHLYQAYVASSEGKDVRIHVVGDKVVASMLRVNEHDFRANITNGGKMIAYSPSKAFEEMAVKVCKVLKVDFAGVDLMFGEAGEPLLCEVNSNAHIKNILDLTGINIAEKIMAYILKEVTK